MPIDASTTFEISTKGDIGDDIIDRARERLGRVARHCRERVDHVELRLVHETAHGDEVRVESTLAVKHGPVRAHAIAPSASEAVDAMIARLRSRLSRHESKLHRIGTKRHDGTAHSGSWHHGDVETAPRRPAPVATQEARVVRRKSFASTPMSVADAVLDLELLDHDFYLFEHHGVGEPDLGAVCLLSRNPDGSLELASDHPIVADLTEPDVRRAPGPFVLSDAGAQRLLDETGDRFVFYRNNGAPSVLYRRYDGDYGTIDLDPRRP